MKTILNWIFAKAERVLGFLGMVAAFLLYRKEVQRAKLESELRKRENNDAIIKNDARYEDAKRRADDSGSLYEQSRRD